MLQEIELKLVGRMLQEIELKLVGRMLQEIELKLAGRTLQEIELKPAGRTLQEIELKLNNDLHEISNWCDENRMVVNVEKNKIMIFMTRQKWQHLSKMDVNICIKADKLKVVGNESLHGLHVDIFLIWKACI